MEYGAMNPPARSRVQGSLPLCFYSATCLPQGSGYFRGEDGRTATIALVLEEGITRASVVVVFREPNETNY